MKQIIKMVTYAALWCGRTGGLLPNPTTKLLPVLPSIYASWVSAKERPAEVWIPLSAATSARKAALAETNSACMSIRNALRLTFLV